MIASYLNDDYRRLDSLMCLLYSLKAQTYVNWEAIVVHDGPLNFDPTALSQMQKRDDRVKVFQTQYRVENFGHPWRRWGIDLSVGDYIGLSNDDNYYCPTYFEWMLSELVKARGQLVYCDMIHSHRGWAHINAKPKRKFIDAGNWIASATLAKATSWDDMSFAGDWTYFEKLYAKAKTVVKVKGCLFVHN